MRRKDREVTDFDTMLSIIDRCDILRLGLADGDYPYIVPVNFAYAAEDGHICLYIHGAVAGRKYELLQKNPRCSFEMDIPLQMDCLPEHKDITMRYESVMGTATAEFLEGDAKQRAVEDVILARYEQTRGFDYNMAALPRTAVVKLTVQNITCKVNPIRGGAD